ncbi:uncharacterized protein LOC135465450 [Liolophura sinensis]|uniref:uncharacterized protein LOC135465450 n=1 Tax=Liolophura sinensis TaxID=3198878 RepID=UPI003158705E
MGTKPLKTVGAFVADICVEDRQIAAEFVVTEGQGQPLLGKDSAEQLGVLRLGHEVNTVQTQSDSNIVEEFRDCFTGFGKLRDFQLRIHIDQTVRPVAQEVRRVPFHLRDNLENKLNVLEKLDIIERVEGPTPWVSPVVVIPKKNGDIRLCVDMRQANTAVLRERHPIPTVDEQLEDRKKPCSSADSHRRDEDKKSEANMSDTKSPQELAEQFERELCWCIEQLELGLSTKAPDSRQAREAVKVLRVLRNPKTLLVKKRQVMRVTFGDYRKKIEAEEKKLAAKASKISLTTEKSSNQSKVYRLCQNKQPSKVDTNQKVDVTTEDRHAQVTNRAPGLHANGELIKDQKPLHFPCKNESGLAKNQQVDDFNTAGTPVQPTDPWVTGTLGGGNMSTHCERPELINTQDQVFGSQESASSVEGDNDPHPITHQPKDTASDKTFKYVKSDNSFRFSFVSS